MKQKRKALFYSPLADSNPHFETDLELVEKHLSEGFDVTILSCQRSLRTCELNPNHKMSICYRCRSRHKSGMRWIGEERVSVESFYKVTPGQLSVVEGLMTLEIDSLDELRRITLEGADVGEAAFSSVVSLSRDLAPSIEVFKDLIKSNLVTAAEVYFSIKNHLYEKKPDVFILYNGRYAPLRPALRAAQKLGVETYVHEVAGVLDRYRLAHNTYPHDLNLFKQEVQDTYNRPEFADLDKAKIAHKWFEERQEHHDQGFQIFTERQDRGSLPMELDSQAVNIAFFNSSEDEMITIKGWENPFYPSQSEGIIQILEEFRDYDEMFFFLRIHPNLKGVENAQTKSIEALDLQFPNLKIISADSPISTYSLVEACDLTITFGSTVGIEAVYMKKPSILMGRAVYEDLGGVIRPSSHKGLIDIIRRYVDSGVLPTVDNCKDAIIKYGFFQKLNGRVFNYVKRHTLYRVSLDRGNRETFIKAGLFSRILVKIGAF